MAGKGAGRGALDAYEWQLGQMAAGEDIDREWLDLQCGDESAHLVLEPLRWALALQPEAIALEQVPPVAPLWKAMANILTSLHGYTCWILDLSAEQFGVAQTRRRAFLIAHRTRTIEHPTTTHKKYVAPRNRDDDGGGLFDLPDAERVTLAHERHLLDWVSMADALGWGMTHRPYPAVASSRTTGGPDKEKVGGSGAREILYGEQAAGRWITDTGNTRSGTRAWTFDRPATTVQADPRIWPPGHKLNADDEAAGREYEGRAGENAIRVTIEEAATLQSFPDDYPWQEAGTRTAAFQCIGNAVPPLMARAVLEAVVR